MLDNPVKIIKGVGETRAKLFEKLGVLTLRDLLHLMPRDYQDFSRITPVAGLEQDMLAATELRLTTEPRLARPRSGLQIVSVTGEPAENSGNFSPETSLFTARSACFSILLLPSAGDRHSAHCLPTPCLTQTASI